MNEQEILQQLGRPNWRVVGRRPEVKTSKDPRTGEQSEGPTGNEVWVISGPNGQSDEIVVKPPPPSTPPADPDFAPARPTPGYTIIEGPSKNPQQTPVANAGWTDITPIRNADGSSTYYGRNPANGKFEKVPDVPDAAAAAGAAGQPKPSPAGQLETIKDPTTGKPIKLRDPSTGTVIDLPDGATPRQPQVIDGPRGAKYSWDGTDLKPLLAGEPAPVNPKEGDTYQAIENGRNVTKTYRGGQWATTSVGESAIPGSAKEGDTRQNVQGGYEIREAYRGGQWVTDPTFQPKPYDPKLSGQPKEGDIRPNVIDGQTIQQVFRGGQWVVDPSVQPKPFGTQPPQVINPGTGPNIVRQDPTTGAISTVPNPNTTDIASRVGQLQQQATAKRDQLQQDVQKGVKTKEEAAAEFDSWWSANVDPYSAQLQRQTQQEDYDRQVKAQEQQRLQSETERAAYGTAQQAGQNAVANATNFGPGIQQVGPGYAGALTSLLGSISSGKMPSPIDASGLVWQAPDLNELARRATAEALAHISPTAASIAGRPMPQIPQSFDVAGALNKSNYQFGSGPTTQIAPDGTVTITHAPQPELPPLPQYVPNAGRGGGLDYALPPQSY